MHKKNYNFFSKYINLIASESFAYTEVLEALSSELTDKYAEGFKGGRYYPGSKYIDEIENKTIKIVKQLFKYKFANVQLYSGSIANFAIYLALLELNDTILSMDLFAGGHLSHGSKNSVVSKFYNIVSYSLDEKTYRLDYQEIEKYALKYKPKLIVCGASSYPFQINFEKFKKIANLVNAYLLADISHLSGLIISNLHPSPFPYADVIMFTTQKQLRGPRGAIIAWNDEKLTKKINKSVFPGIQGGFAVNSVAAKLVCLEKAKSYKYKKYVSKALENAQILAAQFLKSGINLVGGGTETTMCLINIYKTIGFTSEKVQNWLEKANILANKNVIPFEKNSSSKPSGIRIGTLAATLQGLKKKDFINLADWITAIIFSKGNKETIKKISGKVEKLLKKLKKNN